MAQLAEVRVGDQKGEGMRETIPEDLKGYYEDAKKGLAPNESWKDSFVAELIERIAAEKARNKVLEEALKRLRDCDWVITPHDRMDAVREIARAALQEDR